MQDLSSNDRYHCSQVYIMQVFEKPDASTQNIKKLVKTG